MDVGYLRCGLASSNTGTHGAVGNASVCLHGKPADQSLPCGNP